MWLLVFTGAWFWILTALCILLLVCEVAAERSVAAGFTILLYLAAIHLFGNASLFSEVRDNPEYLYIGLPAFFAVGAAWALVKWWFFVKRSALEYRERRMAFLDGKGLTATLDTPVPDSLKAQWGDFQGRRVRVGRRIVQTSAKPLARENKGRIITWMVYWPFSMAWTVLDEPWRLIYEAMSRLFQRISDRIWSDFDADAAAEEEIRDGVGEA
jgi:hypothetical protein